MSYSTHFTGQLVYSQVIKLPNKAKIQQISLETLGSDYMNARRGVILRGWSRR